MLFNSLQFMIYFPIVIILYYLLPHKFRWMMLLGASCIFYMAFIPAYILILFVTIIIDYFAGIWIENSSDQKKKIFLIGSIISTCLVLFVFKYFNFFNASFAGIANFFDLKYPIEMINIILPIGLSFHTFQSLSYVIEVYYGRQKAERNFGVYSLYVMFYPQLVAGPIERPQNLLHQFREEHKFDCCEFTDGLKLMAWGMFKKVVVADRLAEIVNNVYSQPSDFKGITLIIATACFAFQIYCDFSGYSDIAIGAAQTMGFKLMDNFNRPYYSKSISEFWHRWHISLSTWFRDYLYIPLGGSRVGKSRWLFNLFITFAISGLWHGANWTYVIWGSLNGFYLIFAILTKDVREYLVRKIWLFRFFNFKYWQVFTTFSLVCFSWIFFRAKNVSDAWYIVTHLLSGFDKFFTKQFFIETLYSFGVRKKELLITLIVFIIMECVHIFQKNNKIQFFLKQKPIWLRWSFYYLIVFGIIFFGLFGNNDFIYFQF